MGKRDRQTAEDAYDARHEELDRLCGELACRHEELIQMIRVANIMLAD
jgi:DNA-binding Xre family transcriptional regulator